MDDIPEPSRGVDVRNSAGIDLSRAGMSRERGVVSGNAVRLESYGGRR